MGLEGYARGSRESRRVEIGVLEMTSMELNYRTCKETGGDLVCWRGEDLVEVESGGVIEGRRGFQGAPLLGLPLGRVIECSMQLARGTKSRQWRSIAGATSRQWRRTETSSCCAGMSPAATITKCAPDIVNRLKRIHGGGERTDA
jgi:hypothetical protein